LSASKNRLLECALSSELDKSHLRRKFFDAIKALPKEVRNQPTAAHEAVRRIDELYKIERDIGTLPDTERAAVRKDKAARASAHIGVEKSTAQAIADWHYWVSHENQF
jgi:hypothetical protein